MPANTNPIFVSTPKIGWGTLSTANTAKDGSGTLGTDIVTIFTAGDNGARVEKIVFAHLGSNVQTVARIFINNGQGNNIPDNNSLIDEVQIPNNTLSEGIAQAVVEKIFPDGLVLTAGYKINITIGITVASGIKATAFGGDY
jgi:hypothetical protein